MRPQFSTSTAPYSTRSPTSRIRLTLRSPRLGIRRIPLTRTATLSATALKNLVRCALPATARDDASVARAKAAMEAEYSRRWQAKTQPYAGVPELLDALSERQMPMAILSNKPQAFTRLTVDALLPRWSFHPVCGAQPDVPRKPDPAAALYIAAALGHSPEECLYLGDTDTDMQTATRAGMYALGATWGFRSGDELRQSGARDLLDAPLDLLNFL